MIGEQVGSYTILGKLGEGGMGVVYLAQHVTLGRPAAIKFLLPQYSVNPASVQRFFNEARAAASIHHLGIVEVYDFDLTPEGVAYIAMELLNGELLASRIKKGGLGVQSSLGLIRQMCGALGAAHHIGIVHRDLKPENVFVIPDDDVASRERIKLLDFGIAKLTQESGQTPKQTRTGSVIGTPTYMAPEQCRGVPVDHRADIYSLGCILFEMLTGQPPFTGEGDGDVLGAHMYNPPPSILRFLPDAPEALADLISRMLAKAPAERPQTTNEMIDAIDQIVALIPLELRGVKHEAREVPLSYAKDTERVSGGPQYETSPAPPASVAPPPDPPIRRRRRAATIAGVTGAAIGIAAVARMCADTNAQPEPSETDAANIAASEIEIDARFSLDAHMTPPSIGVAVDTIPQGAQVLLSGSSVGVTPFRGELTSTADVLKFTVRRAGFTDIQFEAAGDAPISRVVRLEPRPRTRAPTPLDAGTAHSFSAASAGGEQNAAKVGEDDAVNPY